MSTIEGPTIEERPLADLTPATRTIIAYDRNGSIDVAEPQDQFAEILQTYPVPVRWEGGVAFFHFDDVAEICRNPDIVANDPHTGIPYGMGSEEPLIPLNLDGVAHRTFRKLLDPLLAPRAVAYLEPAIRGLADELIDAFIDEGQVEFHEAFAAKLPGIIFLTLFGLPVDDLEFLNECKDGCIKTGASDMAEMHRLGVISGNRLREYLGAELDRRAGEAEPRDDLIGRFTTFEMDGRRLSKSEILNVMHLFTIAGLDTVTASLTCVVGWLARHPDEQARVMAQPELLAPAIEELLRFENPVLSGGPRWAARDTEFRGCPIREGEMIQACWTTANLDPTHFPDPLSVDFERQGNRHIAFASGPHRCLGSHLARLELRVAVGRLHERIGPYRIAEGDAPAYDHEGVRAAVHLPLVFERS
jgi:cytochrome P450